MLSVLRALSNTSCTDNQNTGLLFQFILYEFITAFTETKQIKAILNRIQKDKTQNLLEEDFNQISCLITKLSGPSHEQIQFFPWKLDGGVLARLKCYCDLYAKNVDQLTPEITLLEGHVNKAWINGFHSLEFLKESRYPMLKKKGVISESLSQFFKLLEKVYSYMKKIANIIAEHVHQFSHDENVIFFLIRYHKHFSELYGPKFIGKLIAKMYPKGIKQAENFLKMRYQKRGFDHLLPFISRKVSEIS